MKGIIQQNMQPEQAQSMQGGAEQGEQADSKEQQAPSGQQGEQATPEEQESYEKVVLAGLKVLYDDQTNPGVMKMLQAQKDDPAKALADVTSMVITQLDEQSGGTLPEVTILPATEEILGEVAGLAAKAGIFQPDDRALALASQQTLRQLGDHYGVSEEEIQELIQSLPQDRVQQMVQQQSQFAQPQQGA